jgi:hypothetical protein
MARAPSEDEAVAIAAAIERFRGETAASDPEKDVLGPWQRTALLEGVSAKGAFEKSEGGERWLS